VEIQHYVARRQVRYSALGALGRSLVFGGGILGALAPICPAVRGKVFQVISGKK
jgi:hypothetical protein